MSSSNFGIFNKLTSTWVHPNIIDSGLLSNSLCNLIKLLIEKVGKMLSEVTFAINQKSRSKCPDDCKDKEVFKLFKWWVSSKVWWDKQCIQQKGKLLNFGYVWNWSDCPPSLFQDDESKLLTEYSRLCLLLLIFSFLLKPASDNCLQVEVTCVDVENSCPWNWVASFKLST